MYKEIFALPCKIKILLSPIKYQTIMKSLVVPFDMINSKQTWNKKACPITKVKK